MRPHRPPRSPSSSATESAVSSPSWGRAWTPDWIGVPVVTTTGDTGGHASLALARTADLHRVPEPLGLPDATALLADGRTALGLHQAAGIRPGETVVITAAGGGPRRDRRHP